MAYTGWVATHTGMPSMRFTDTTAGRMYQVTATDGENEWVALRVRGDGGDLLWSDPLAPVGVPVTYRHGAWEVTLTRASMGGHMLTDADGHVHAPFRWLGADDTDHNVDVTSTSTSGGYADRWPLVAPEETITLEASTGTESTRVFRALVASQRRLVLVHDETVCEMVDCDIPPVRVVTVSKASEARTKAVPHARRVWDLALEDRSSTIDATLHKNNGQLPTIHHPVVVWGEWDAYEGAWQARTYTALCRLIAGMPS